MLTSRVDSLKPLCWQESGEVKAGLWVGNCLTLWATAPAVCRERQGQWGRNAFKASSPAVRYHLQLFLSDHSRALPMGPFLPLSPEFFYLLYGPWHLLGPKLIKKKKAQCCEEWCMHNSQDSENKRSPGSCLQRLWCDTRQWGWRQTPLPSSCVPLSLHPGSCSIT